MAQRKMDGEGGRVGGDGFCIADTVFLVLSVSWVYFFFFFPLFPFLMTLGSAFYHNGYFITSNMGKFKIRGVDMGSWVCHASSYITDCLINRQDALRYIRNRRTHSLS